ncbi:hypothetical protein U3516DRAFT_606082, partial [Neocallimastix sp. 'constans']
MNYMEMSNDEMNDFISSCVYHQIVFILKNIISKSIDFMLNQNMYILRIAKKKENQLNKTQYYEYSSFFTLYEYGIIYLSKYVTNHGLDYYDDHLITFSTDIYKLNQKIINNYSDDNWYVGRQEPYDTDGHLEDVKKEDICCKPIISNLIDNDNNNKNDNIKNSSFENKIKYDNINIKYDLCDIILDLLNDSIGRDDINLGKSLHEIIDLYYYPNIEEKYHSCKKCLKNNDYGHSKEYFIEILKLLKYFINLNEYTSDNCLIYRCNNQINDFLYSDPSIITYDFYFKELIKMEFYYKGIGKFIENFRYLIDKANSAINQGTNTLNIDSTFENFFF